MPTTPNLALPYPSASDTADVPRDIQGLANKLDALTQITAAGAVRIANQTLAANAPAGIDFTSIPQTYAHLLMVAQFQTAGTAGGVFGLYGQLNGDTAANYWSHTLYATSSVTTGPFGAAATQLELGAAAGSSSLQGGYLVMLIPHYAQATTRHSTMSLSAAQGGLAAWMKLGYNSGFWTQAAAVNRVRIFSDQTTLAGSRATLYGLG